jgi:hypothetical protein
MRPAPPPEWHQHQARLPRCFRCRCFLEVKVHRLGAGADSDPRQFTVECHGEREQVVLSAAEVKGMIGYTEAFR